MEISLFQQDNDSTVSRVSQNPNAGPATQKLLEQIKDLPEEKQQEIISRVFNPELTPQDINNKIKSGEAYEFTSIAEFQKFKAFKEQEEGNWLRDIAAGVSAVPTIVGDAIGAAINSPAGTAKKALPSLVEGLAQNGRDTYGMFWQSNDPSSPFFRFKAAFNKNDDPYLEMRQTNEAIRFQKMSNDLFEGKTSLILDKDLIDPKVTQLVATLVDPEIFVPFAGPISGSVGLARLAGFGDAMTKAAIRAQRIKAGVLGGTLKWGIGVPAEFIGNLAQNSIEYGVKKGANVLESLTGIDADDIVRTGRAAGIATASAHVAGYSLPYAGPIAATHLGGGLVSGFGQAVRETGNQVLRSQGNRGVLGFARQALVDAEQNGIQFSKQGKMFARIIDTFDPAFSYTLSAVEGGITGGLIGAGLSYGSQGADGVGQGVGFGLGAGVVGAASGRLLAAGTGSLKRLRNDIQAQFSISMLGEIDRVTAIDLDRTRSDPRARPEDVDAINLTAHALASLEGTVHYRAFGGGIDSGREFAAWKKSRDGKGIQMSNSDFSRVEAFFVQRGDDGALYIGVNLDNLYSGKGRDYAKNTIPHELLHSILKASAVGPHFMAMGRDLLVGVRDENGKIVQEGLVGRSEFEEFAGQYMDAEFGKEIWAKLPEGDEKTNLRERWFTNRNLIKSALDKLDGEGGVGTQTKMTVDEVKALNNYTEEFLAYYFSAMFNEMSPTFFLKKGELDGMESVMDFIKSAWKDHWENRVSYHEPRFNFFRQRGNAIDAGFEKDGSRVRVGALDYFLKDMLKASMSLKSKGFVDFEKLSPATREKFLRAGASSVLYKDPKSGKVRPKTKREIAADNSAKGIAGFKVLEAMDPNLRRSQTGADGVIRGDFSDAEFDALVQNGVITATEANYGKLFQRTKDDRTLPNVFEYGYLGKSKQIEGGKDNDRVRGSAVPVTNREILMADFFVEFGQNGEFAMRIRGLDMKVIGRRKSMLWQNPTVRALWNDDNRMFAKDFRAYLSNLSLPHNDPDRVPTSQWLNQRYGDGLGDARRDVLHQVAGFAKSEDLPYANTPVATIPRGTLMAVTDFTVDSMINLRTSGENYNYIHANAFYDVARNFKPAAFKPRVGLADASMYTNEIGYQLVKSKGIFKAFSPSGMHIANSENMKKVLAASEEHFEKAIANETRKSLKEHSEQLSKFKFRVDPESIRSVIEGRSKIEEIPEIRSLIGTGNETAMFSQQLHAEYLASNFDGILKKTEKGVKKAKEILTAFRDNNFSDITDDKVREMKDGYYTPDNRVLLFSKDDIESDASVLAFLNRLFNKETGMSEQRQLVARLITKGLDIQYAKEVLGGNSGKDSVVLSLHTPRDQAVVRSRVFENQSKLNEPYTYFATGAGHVGYLGKMDRTKMLLRDSDGRTYGQFGLVAVRLKKPVIIDQDRVLFTIREGIRNAVNEGTWNKFLADLGAEVGSIKQPVIDNINGRIRNLSIRDLYYLVSLDTKMRYGDVDVIQIQNSYTARSTAPAINTGTSVSIAIASKRANDNTALLGFNFTEDPSLSSMNLSPKNLIEGRLPSQEVKRILESRTDIDIPITSARAANYINRVIPSISGTNNREYQIDSSTGVSDEVYYPTSNKVLAKPKTPDEYYIQSYIENGIDDGSTIRKIKEDIESALETSPTQAAAKWVKDLSEREFELLKTAEKLLRKEMDDVEKNNPTLTADEYSAKIQDLFLKYIDDSASAFYQKWRLRSDYEISDNLLSAVSGIFAGNDIREHVTNTSKVSELGSTNELIAASDRHLTTIFHKYIEYANEVIEGEKLVKERSATALEWKKLSQREPNAGHELNYRNALNDLKNQENFLAKNKAIREAAKKVLLERFEESKGNIAEFREMVLNDTDGIYTVKMVKRESSFVRRYSSSAPTFEDYLGRLGIEDSKIAGMRSDISEVADYLYAQENDFATIVRNDDFEALVNEIRENAVVDGVHVEMRNGVKLVTTSYPVDVNGVVSDAINAKLNAFSTRIDDLNKRMRDNRRARYEAYDKADDVWLEQKAPTSYNDYLSSHKTEIDGKKQKAVQDKLGELATTASAEPWSYSKDYVNALNAYRLIPRAVENMFVQLGVVGLRNSIFKDLDNAVSGADSSQAKSQRVHDVLHKNTDTAIHLELLKNQKQIKKQHFDDFSQLDFKFMFRNTLKNQLVDAFSKNPNGIKAKEILRLIELITSQGVPVKAEADAIGLIKYLNELEVARRGKDNEKIQANEVLEYIDKNMFTVWAKDQIGLIDLDRGATDADNASTRKYILGSESGFGEILDYGTNAAYVDGPSKYYPSQFASPHAMPKDRNIVHTRYTKRRNTAGRKIIVTEEVQANNSQHDYEEALAAEKIVSTLEANGDKIAEQVISLIRESLKSNKRGDSTWRISSAAIDILKNVTRETSVFRKGIGDLSLREILTRGNKGNITNLNDRLAFNFAKDYASAAVRLMDADVEMLTKSYLVQKDLAVIGLTSDESISGNGMPVKYMTQDAIFRIQLGVNERTLNFIRDNYTQFGESTGQQQKYINAIRSKVFSKDFIYKLYDMIRSDAIKYLLKNRRDVTNYIDFSSWIGQIVERNGNPVKKFIDESMAKSIQKALAENSDEGRLLQQLGQENATKLAALVLQSVDHGRWVGYTTLESTGVHRRILDSLIQSVSHRIDTQLAKADLVSVLNGKTAYDDNTISANVKSRVVVDGVEVEIPILRDPQTSWSHGHVWGGRDIEDRQYATFGVLQDAAEFLTFGKTTRYDSGDKATFIEHVIEELRHNLIGRAAEKRSTGNSWDSTLDIPSGEIYSGSARHGFVMAKKAMSSAAADASSDFGLSQNFIIKLTEKIAVRYRNGEYDEAMKIMLEGFFGDRWRVNAAMLANIKVNSKDSTSGDSDSLNAIIYAEQLAKAGIPKNIVDELSQNRGESYLASDYIDIKKIILDMPEGPISKEKLAEVRKIIEKETLRKYTGDRQKEERKKFTSLLFQPSNEYRLVAYRMALRRAALDGASRMYLTNADLTGSISGFPHRKARIQYSKTDPNIVRKEAKRLGLKVYEAKKIAELEPEALATLSPDLQRDVTEKQTKALDSIKAMESAYGAVVKGLKLVNGRVKAEYTQEIQALLDAVRSKHGNTSGMSELLDSPFAYADTNDRQNKYVLNKYEFVATPDESLRLIEKIVVDSLTESFQQGKRGDDITSNVDEWLAYFIKANTGSSKDGLALTYRHSLKALRILDLYQSTRGINPAQSSNLSNIYQAYLIQDQNPVNGLYGDITESNKKVAHSIESIELAIKNLKQVAQTHGLDSKGQILLDLVVAMNNEFKDSILYYQRLATFPFSGTDPSIAPMDWIGSRVLSVDTSPENQSPKFKDEIEKGTYFYKPSIGALGENTVAFKNDILGTIGAETGIAGKAKLYATVNVDGARRIIEVSLRNRNGEPIEDGINESVYMAVQNNGSSTATIMSMSDDAGSPYQMTAKDELKIRCYALGIDDFEEPNLAPVNDNPVPSVVTKPNKDANKNEMAGKPLTGKQPLDKQETPSRNPSRWTAIPAGTGMTLTTADGYFISIMNNKFRLYNVNRELIGIYSDEAEARRKAEALRNKKTKR